MLEQEKLTQLMLKQVRNQMTLNADGPSYGDSCPKLLNEIVQAILEGQLHVNGNIYDIMSYEYGEDDDWVGLDSEDLDTIRDFKTEYKNFALSISYAADRKLTIFDVGNTKVYVSHWCKQIMSKKFIQEKLWIFVEKGGSNILHDMATLRAYGYEVFTEEK